ncbi:MAG: phosphopyruvate hydratase [Patescibacteria group bacterium]|nr:phosphopyruvate hydratase [Patescibacteria group bacterium]
MGTKIKNIKAREILDSRGNPTVAVDMELEGDIRASASVPSGASTGTREALELRDGDKKRYGGKGVLKAVANVNNIIAPKLRGMDVTKQRRLDEVMLDLDGTENKTKLGANAILGVSLAAARAAAARKDVPLYQWIRQAYDLTVKGTPMPLPMMNILNGGAHADWTIDFQECIIIPKQKLFRERVRCGSEVYHALGKILKNKGFSTGVGDEGGYAPRLPSNEEAFKLILDAIESSGYAPGRDVMVGMDVAASEFYDKARGVYQLKCEKRELSSTEMIRLYEKWLAKYPIMTIEDGLSELDWDNWEALTKKLGKKLALVGDDIFVTNAKILDQGIKRGVGNAILIKVNQIGSLSETMDTIALAREHGYKLAISHRSGETADTFIADLAVAVGAEFIKTGSLARSERLEKYNRLMEIELEG